MKFSLFIKTTSHRVFNFKPRYYNADKEAFEQRVKDIQLMTTAGVSEVDAIKTRVKHHYANKKIRHKINDSKQRNFRLIILIALLSGLTYWILK